MDVELHRLFGFAAFPGGFPLYRNGKLIGVSGDGLDQDDLIAASGIGAMNRNAGLRRSSPPAVHGPDAGPNFGDFPCT